MFPFALFYVVLCFRALTQICRIESVSHLSELRVLNLAGNSVCRVENLRGLHRLTELNLRHNRISAVVRRLFRNNYLKLSPKRQHVLIVKTFVSDGHYREMVGVRIF